MLASVGQRPAAARPLIVRSWAKIASIWWTASTASGAGGAFCGAGEVGELEKLPPGMGPAEGLGHGTATKSEVVGCGHATRGEF